MNSKSFNIFQYIFFYTASLKVSIDFYINILYLDFLKNTYKLTFPCSISESETVDRNDWWDGRCLWKAGLVIMEPVSLAPQEGGPSDPCRVSPASDSWEKSEHWPIHVINILCIERSSTNHWTFTKWCWMNIIESSLTCDWSFDNKTCLFWTRRSRRTSGVAVSVPSVSGERSGSCTTRGPDDKNALSAIISDSC